MSIDRQRIEAVRFLEVHGFRFSPAEGWTGGQLLASVAIPEHSTLMDRADALQGCAVELREHRELKVTVDAAIGAYEDMRGQLGKMAGGKG